MASSGSHRDSELPARRGIAKIFLGEDRDCPTFEGKGLICANGGSADDVLCEAHLACGNGTVLEKLTIAKRKGAKKNGREPENERRSGDSSVARSARRRARMEGGKR